MPVKGFTKTFKSALLHFIIKSLIAAIINHGRTKTAKIKKNVDFAFAVCLTCRNHWPQIIQT